MHDEIVVTDRTPGAAAIHFLPLLASGSTVPIRSISGPATGLTDPLSVAVDPVHDEVFVTSGDTAPLRSITGALTQLNGPSFHSYFPWLVFADGFDYGTADSWSDVVP